MASLIQGALIACCVMAALVVGGIVNEDAVPERKPENDKVGLPEITIQVRTYPKNSGRQNNRQNIQSQNYRPNFQSFNNFKDGTNFKFPMDIKAEQNDGKVLDRFESAAKADSRQDIQRDSARRIIENKDEGILNAGPYFTSSVWDLSRTASLAWTYVTQAIDTTERPGASQADMPNLNNIEKMQDKAVINSIDINIEKTKLEPIEFTNIKGKNNEIVLQSDGDDKNIQISAVEQSDTNSENKTKIELAINGTDNNSTQVPAHTKIKNLGQKINLESSKGRPLSPTADPDSVAFKARNDKEKSSSDRMASSSQRYILDVTKHEPDGEGAQRENILYGDDNTAKEGYESGNPPDNTHWFKWPWFSLGSDSSKGRTEKNHILGDEPEDDMEAETGSAVVGFDGDHNSLVGPPALSVQSFGPGISPNSIATVAEADLNTSDVANLINRYHTCETCMVAIYNTSLQCQYYSNNANEFDKWARDVSDLLKYGCSGQGAEHDMRCCHAPDEAVRSVADQLSKLTKSIAYVLRKQCERCPVDCVWNEWGSWSSCKPTCGPPGYRNRSRSQKGERYWGRSCPGESTQREACPEQKKEYGSWLDWSSWSGCSSTCGGTRHRNRKCSEPTSCSCFVPCEGDSLDVEPCGDPKLCCNARTWSQWGSWTECIVVDANSRKSQKTRWRSCDPDEKYPDQPICRHPCSGPSQENSPCCEISVWGEWTAWSECIGTDNLKHEETGKQCGEGCKSRTRECINGTCPNMTCYGDHIERLLCKLDPCCAPPVWSAWGLWSACSVSSGMGSRKRSRSCQANPEHWGSPICRAGGCYRQPDDTEAEDCRGSCAACIQPSWSSWGSWSDCDFSQVRPIRARRRWCNISSWDPNCRHLHCHGSDSERDECICGKPVWTHWSAWGPCDYSKNPPFRRSSRACQPVSNPSYCIEELCSGDEERTEICCRRQEWLSWGQWSTCDYRREQPSRSRTRKCSPPDAHCPDKRCDGFNTEEMDCLVPTTYPPLPNCDEGRWTTWGSWSSCECQETKRRTRWRQRLASFFAHPRLTLCLPLSEQYDENCENQCDGCEESCADRKDGKYPSCRPGCRSYITCCQNKPLWNDCGDGQQYDSVCQRCRKPPSPTCVGGQFDIYRNATVVPSAENVQCTDT